MQFQYRASQTRGGADHGWLKTFHTFSFANYYDEDFESFGSLRVINEDRVAPSTGFPLHPHREAEIFSYIISGELSHKDTMGNVETMKRGDIQMTSGGTGIAHSEFNSHSSLPNHFLQIWATPSQRGLKPGYYARHFTDEQKKDKLCKIVAPVGTEGVVDERDGLGPTPIHSPFTFFASLLSPDKHISHTISAPLSSGKDEKRVYIQLIQTSGYNTKEADTTGMKGTVLKVVGGGDDTVLGEGDGVFIRGGKIGESIQIENFGSGIAEFVLFELD